MGFSSSPGSPEQSGGYNVLLIHPRFSGATFFADSVAAAVAPLLQQPLGLITVAAMLPPTWNLRLLDWNCEEITEADWAWPDVVFTGGMLPQQAGTLDVVRAARARGIPVVVGGPDVSSSPHLYEEADFRVLGEAELVMADFIAAWESGARSGVFEAEKFKADVTRTPIPRFDLVNFDFYVRIGVQFSRGCPFSCEFCDIIELYGRVPRAKTTDQMLAELQALYDLGYRGRVDFVDDNLVGNKKALRALLPALIEWQSRHDYPFELSTEASINVASDDEVLRLMREANFEYFFVGIESPDEETLVGTRKTQNTRRDMVESVHKIYAHGMWVYAGFILGFDDERGSVAAPMVRFIEDAAIPVCMVGLLYALPNTRLTRRLESEGRLFAGYDVNVPGGANADQSSNGLNFITARQRRDILEDYVRVLEEIYRPDAFFGRVRRVARALVLSGPTRRNGPLTPGSLFRAVAGVSPKQFFEGMRILRAATGRPRIAVPFWRTLLACLVTNPRAIKAVMTQTANYLHLERFHRLVARLVRHQIDALDGGTWRQPELAPPSRVVSLTDGRTAPEPGLREA